MAKRKTTQHFSTSDEFWAHVGPLVTLGRVEVLKGKWHAYWKPRGRIPDFTIKGAFSVPHERTEVSLANWQEAILQYPVGNQSTFGRITNRLFERKP